MRTPRAQIVVVASWLALGAALLPAASAFSRPMEGTLGKASWSFTLSAVTILGFVLTALAALGTHAVISAHPKARSGDLSHTAHYWAAPVVLTAAALVHIARLHVPAPYIGALVGLGALAGLALSLEYATVDGDEAGYAGARWMLNVVVYLIALVAFSAALPAGLSRGHAAVACALAAALLAVDLLRLPERTPDVVAAYALAAGAAVGLAADRLLLSEIETIRISLILLLLLYALTGVMQQQLRGRASWRVRVEYLALVALGTWALLQW